tara:strand:+ start:161 stop:277 length:117 start_codon:yes stop_codon:yes gene_type:complete
VLKVKVLFIKRVKIFKEAAKEAAVDAAIKRSGQLLQQN